VRFFLPYFSHLFVIYWQAIEKDFDGWNSQKKHINDHAAALFYHKRGR